MLLAHFIPGQPFYSHVFTLFNSINNPTISKIKQIEMKERKEKQTNEKSQASLLTKDESLENFITTFHRAETIRDGKLLRFHGKAVNLFGEIKRQHEEIKDVNRLKSTDLILLQQRLRNTEHKLKQIRTSIKIKLTRLIQEEKSISSCIYQLNKEMATEKILDISLINEAEVSHMELERILNKRNFESIDVSEPGKELMNKKIIEDLVQELHTFKIRAHNGSANGNKI